MSTKQHNRTTSDKSYILAELKVKIPIEDGFKAEIKSVNGSLMESYLALNAALQNAATKHPYLKFYELPEKVKLRSVIDAFGEVDPKMKDQVKVIATNFPSKLDFHGKEYEDGYKRCIERDQILRRNDLGKSKGL